ncbi:MAG: hypothetical protein ACLUOI_16220 [Eisenbergiella sp.]
MRHKDDVQMDFSSPYKSGTEKIRIEGSCHPGKLPLYRKRQKKPAACFMQLLPAVRISGQKKGEKFMMTAFETIQAETVPTDNENNFPQKTAAGRA